MADDALIDAVKALKNDNFTTGANWEACHDLCQRHEGEADYDLGHALVHLIEGDLPNAGYWYSRAGQTQQHQDLEAEWGRVVAVLEKS